MIHFAHIPIPKSGSKFLQYTLFKNHPDLFVVGKEGGCAKSKALNQKLLEPKYKAEGDFHPELFASSFYRLLEAESSENQVKGISSEQLSGRMVSGKYGDLFAERLKASFGVIKIIIIFRHPVRWVESVYSTYLRLRGTDNYKQFLKHISDPSHEHYAEKRLNYKAYLNKYQSLFGASNVLSLPYELLKHNPEAFNQRVSTFLGIRQIPLDILTDIDVVNPRLEPFDEWLIQKLNKVWIPKPDGKKIRLGRTYAKLRRDSRFSFPKILNERFRTHWKVEDFEVYNMIKQNDYTVFDQTLAEYNYNP